MRQVVPVTADIAAVSGDATALSLVTAYALGIWQNPANIGYQLWIGAGGAGAEVSATTYYTLQPISDPTPAWFVLDSMAAVGVTAAQVTFPIQGMRISVMCSLASAPSLSNPAWAFGLIQVGNS